MISLGTDIVEINRIRSNLKNKKSRFLNRIFTQLEVDYCNSKSNPSIHFAGKFAAKEAVKKAVLSTKKINQISLKDIEILSNCGDPKVSIKGNIEIFHSIEVSISHTDSIATATAILLDNKS